MTKHDRMDVESILVNQTKVGQAPCQVWSGYVDLPLQLSLQPADHRLDVILDECGVGSDRLQRARHDPLPLAPPHRREVAVLRVPIRKIIVPITHDRVHAATVHRARQAARPLDEVTRERGIGWPDFHVVDVAVQVLVQSVHELRHATKPPTQVLRAAVQGRAAPLTRAAICCTNFLADDWTEPFTVNPEFADEATARPFLSRAMAAAAFPFWTSTRL